MKLPQDMGPIHFVGIGGIGMSGIAEVLNSQGYTVQGSDMAENANVARLRDLGMDIAIGHGAANLKDADVIVVSSAIERDNVELVVARERKLPVVRRAEMLAELMRFKQAIAVGGTHGKTTTTSMVAALLDAGGFNPTVINGGVINSYGSNALMQEGDWMVVEADESDGTFVKLPADVVVVTNIDPEHLDHYGNIDNIRSAYAQFVENVPFYGYAVMCLDHPEVQALFGKIEDRKVITYGENPQADYRIQNVSVNGMNVSFSVVVRDRAGMTESEIGDLTLPMPGIHNVANATAAIALAHQMNIEQDVIRKALASFGGVKRRFTHIGDWNGVKLFDDYGHHPVEIRAVLRAARESCKGNVITVMQPHRYTRVFDLFDDFCSCFNDADTVFIAPVYSAGEKPIAGAHRDDLITGLRTRGHRAVFPIDSVEELAPKIAEISMSGDFVMFLGAGNITQWASALPDLLANVKKEKLS